MSDLSQELSVVSLDSRIFGGESSLSFEDFGDLANQLPKQVLKPGNALLCDPVLLRPFKNRVKAIQRLLQSVGVRYKQGYAIAIRKRLKDGSDKPILEPILLKAQAIQAELDVLKAEFIAKYDENLNKWIETVQDEFPDWAKKIRAYAPTASEVESRIYFHLDVEGFGLPVMLPSVGDGGLARRLEGLPLQILKEISLQAREWKGKEGGTNVNQFRERMAVIRDKLTSLSMLDASGYIEKASDLVDDLLVRLPHDGKLKGSDYWMARSIMDKFLKPEEFFTSELEDLTFDKIELDEAEVFNEELEKRALVTETVTQEMSGVEQIESGHIDEILQTTEQDNSLDDFGMEADMLDF